MRRTLVLAYALSALLLTACAGRSFKADIPPIAVPAEEITKLEKDINGAYSEHVDVLAAKEFDIAQLWLKRAQTDQSLGRSQSKILDDVAFGRGYLDRAKGLAEQRRAPLDGVLDARSRAIEAGAKNYRPERARMKKLDDRIRSMAGGSISVPRYNQLMGDYMDLELAAIQATQLDAAIAKVDGARREGAARNTPRTLRQAEREITNAKNAIASNRHHPESFKDEVTRANQSADLLVAVLNATKRPGETLPEDAALEMVRSGRQISNLQRQLGAVEAQQEQLTQTLSQKAQELTRAQASQKLESALESARKEFSPEEAEVYRQGDRLLIRLKAMNFSSGRSELPPSALPLLAKIRTVTADLKPQQVVVEGHTDSTGSAQLNAQLSQERAQAVAEYLSTSGVVEANKIQAVGQSFKHPLTSNKTREGRAQNRRVDVIITPTQTM